MKGMIFFAPMQHATKHWAEKLLPCPISSAPVFSFHACVRGCTVSCTRAVRAEDKKENSRGTQGKIFFTCAISSFYISMWHTHSHASTGEEATPE